MQTLDWERLQHHLQLQGHTLALEERPQQLNGGLANRNFSIHFDGQIAVLRCPPTGELPPGAHDMKRENFILSRLWRLLGLAPRAYYFSEDISVIGVPFQINEYKEGIVLRGAELGDLENEESIGDRLANILIETLVDIHNVNLDEIGLDHLGKPIGFIERNVESWIKRSEMVTGGSVSTSVRELAKWLRSHQVPDTHSPRLLHNDFKLDNMVLDRNTLEPVAVLDWDMGTRDHPLLDLATLLSYWTEVDDPDCMHELGQMPTARANFPTRNQVAIKYADLTRMDLSDFLFFRILAMFKLGVVFQQLHRLYQDGKVMEPSYELFGLLGSNILDYTMSTAHERLI